TDTIADVFAGGYAYVGTANGIFNKNDILAEDKTALKQSVRKLAEELERLVR
ncbi:MAG: 2-dehydro-3-deoxyphosphogluconate aldolase, partial [Atopobium sp.]|nr:2-dehydro-3-deoxyphosphogluconate aldolase [Atopobium sp.]